MQKKRKIKKIYTGLVYGLLKEEKGEVRYPIGRNPTDRKLFTAGGIKPKRARTWFRVVRTIGNYSLVKFRLITGRTHQIRVHMKGIGHPIVGDLQYGNGKREVEIGGKEYSLDGHMLTATELHFKHPVTGKKLDLEVPFRYFHSDE